MHKNRVRYSAQCLILFVFGQEFTFRSIPNNITLSCSLIIDNKIKLLTLYAEYELVLLTAESIYYK